MEKRLSRPDYTKPLPEAVICYRNLVVGLDDMDLDEILASEFPEKPRWETGISPAELIIANDPDNAPRLPATPEPKRPVWEKLAQSSCWENRLIAAKRNVALETWLALLSDRSAAVRRAVLGNEFAMNELALLPAGRKALLALLEDEDCRKMAARSIENLNPKAAREIVKLIEKADKPAAQAREAAAAAAPAMTLQIGHGGDALDIPLRNDNALSTGTYLIIAAYRDLSEKLLESELAVGIDEDARLAEICLLFADDPRVAVRTTAARETPAESEAARRLALDHESAVRKAVYELPEGLSRDEIKEFLGNDPERIVEFMDEILKGPDARYWSETFLSDPDPSVRSEALSKGIIFDRSSKAEDEEELDDSDDDIIVDDDGDDLFDDDEWIIDDEDEERDEEKDEDEEEEEDDEENDDDSSDSVEGSRKSSPSVKRGYSKQ